MKPSKPTLDFPATTIAPQRAAVLGDWFAPVPAVRCDQFHTEMFAHTLIQRIAIVRLVAACKTEWAISPNVVPLNAG